MKVPFLDLRVIDQEERAELLAAVDTVLCHGRIVLGPEVQELEWEVAARCGRKYAVGVGSGTDALYVALRALEIGPGDEVVTTPLSFVATANAIALTGATPIFADIGDDLNLDPSTIEQVLSPRTKAIMPVHYTGKLCQMDPILRLAEERQLLVIEDASQAFGAAYQGRTAGAFGEIGCFSMNPMKVFAACGEAGMIVTDRDEMRDRIVALRYNGLVNREFCHDVSLNGRLDTLQAAILLQRLARVDGIIARRREIAGWYHAALAGLVGVPGEAPGYRDVYYTYTIRTDRRDELKAFLESRSIETRIQHPLLMPEQPVHRGKVKGEFPHAERLVRQVLCIPNNEKLTQPQVEYVAGSIKQFFCGEV